MATYDDDDTTLVSTGRVRIVFGKGGYVYISCVEKRVRRRTVRGYVEKGKMDVWS